MTEGTDSWYSNLLPTYAGPFSRGTLKLEMSTKSLPSSAFCFREPISLYILRMYHSRLGKHSPSLNVCWKPFKCLG